MASLGSEITVVSETHTTDITVKLSDSDAEFFSQAAAGYATKALQYRNQAETFATSAQTNANIAGDESSAAHQSAQAAALSAQNAATSATNAGTSETNAGNYEANALSYANSAQEYMQSASNSRNNAALSASQAQRYATNASQSAADAQSALDNIQTTIASKQDKLTAGANITIDSNNVISATGGSGGGAVNSVNGQTGTVVLDAEDVGALPDTTTASDLGAYVKPSGGIPKTDLASAVQTSLGKADTALQTAPVSSVDGKTGTVTVIPTGGTTGQVLAKASATDRDVEWITPSGGGLTQAQINALNGLFRICAYSEDATAEYTAFCSAFGITTYTITNNLTNATNSNSATSIAENFAYTATITADAPYAIDTVTVTMGGVDITASVYADGEINIPSVTGNVIITVTASEYGQYTWLYRSSDGVLLSARTDVITPTITRSTETLQDGLLNIVCPTATTSNTVNYALIDTTSTNAVLKAKFRINDLVTTGSLRAYGFRLQLSDGSKGIMFYEENLNGTLKLLTYAGGTAQSVCDLTADTWYIVEVEMNNGTYTIKLDGETVYTSTTGATYYCTANKIAVQNSGAGGSGTTDIDVAWVAYLDND